MIISYDIIKLCIDKCDPVGLLKIHAPSDEYDSESAKICNSIKNFFVLLVDSFDIILLLTRVNIILPILKINIKIILVGSESNSWPLMTLKPLAATLQDKIKKFWLSKSFIYLK